MATTPAPKDSITTALAPSRQAFFHSIWRELWPKLSLTSASDLFTSDLEVAETLLSWLQDESCDSPRNITTFSPQQKNSNPNNNLNIKLLQQDASSPPDDTFSHAFAHLTIYRAAQTLAVLKQVFYALQPKGIALVTITKSNPVDSIVQAILSPSGRRRQGSASSITPGSDSLPTESSLREMAETAGFELGKIRVMEREIRVQGAELERLRGEVLKILDAAVGMQGDGQSWEKGFDEMWEREVGGTEKGGIKVECWVVVAKKWDLLCA